MLYICENCMILTRRNWEYGAYCVGSELDIKKRFLDSLSMIQNDPGMRVDLPHDAMISTKVSPNAAAKYDSGYFEGVMCNYTKQILIPMDWNEECIGLQF